MLHCTFVKIFAMHALSENYITERRINGQYTFDVGRVRVLEYMRTCQEYFGKLPILIRFKEYVDNMFKCIHSVNGNF